MPTPEDDFDNQDDPEQQPKRNFRRELEDRLTAAEQRAAAAERRAVIAEAGLTNLTDRQRTILASQIDGEATADQVKQIAGELGWGSEPAASPDPSAEEIAALDRVTQGLTDPTAPPRQNAEEVMARALAEGGIEALMQVAPSLGLETSWSQQ